MCAEANTSYLDINFTKVCVDVISNACVSHNSGSWLNLILVALLPGNWLK